MDKNFFKKIRILDGGMGQQLLNKGLISKGTLWSASANLDMIMPSIFFAYICSLNVW